MAAPPPKLRRTPLERAPRPELGHERIPKQRYTSAEFASLERERLWSRVWQMAGFERDLAEPGDYFAFETGPESVLAVRQDDGEIRAFHNVCMHRGNRLREPGRGWARFFECSYHAWRYGRDGELLAQDFYNLPRIQKGMNSSGFEGLHLGDQELRIRHFHRTLEGYLRDGDACP